jgi:hypothetical protein
MSIKFVCDFLLWCLVANYVVLLLWFLVFMLARDWIFRLHTSWFGLSGTQFDAIHYSGMALYKICILVFNLTPFVAARVVMSHGS